MSDDPKRTIIFTRAHVPDDLAKAWLQHLRDFDLAHPGCHFEVLADTMHIPLEVMVEMLKINPGFSFQRIFNFKKD